LPDDLPEDHLPEPVALTPEQNRRAKGGGRAGSGAAARGRCFKSCGFMRTRRIRRRSFTVQAAHIVMTGGGYTRPIQDVTDGGTDRFLIGTQRSGMRLVSIGTRFEPAFPVRPKGAQSSTRIVEA
jgi:hypothetical protein